jgi:hypothetical protein
MNRYVGLVSVLSCCPGADGGPIRKNVILCLRIVVLFGDVREVITVPYSCGSLQLVNNIVQGHCVS